MNAQMGDGSINKQWCIVLQSCDEIKKLNMNLKQTVQSLLQQVLSGNRLEGQRCINSELIITIERNSFFYNNKNKSLKKISNI